MPSIRTRLTPRALLELKTPDSPKISPDGTLVAFAVVEADFEESRNISHLWLADVKGANARQITFSYEGEREPRWSPDGKWLAFLSTRPDMTEPPAEDDHEEEERAHRDQIWLLPAGGGEAERLTSCKSCIRDYRWMPDGKSILYLMPEVRLQPSQSFRDAMRKHKMDPVVEHDDKLRMQIWEVQVEDKKPELVHTGDCGIAEFEVSPDGKKLVFSSNGTGEPNDFYQFDLHLLDLEGSADPVKLVERAGGKFQPKWSSDGNTISFLANLDPSLSYSQECLFKVSVSGGEPVNLFATKSYDAVKHEWTGNGELLAIVADRMREPLVKFGDSGETMVAPAFDGLECLDFDAQGSIVVAVLEDAETPPELYLIESDGTRRALTELGKGFRESHLFPEQRVLTWKCDGFEIEARLFLPPNTSEIPEAPLPTIVINHGGPKGHIAGALRSYSMPAVWASEGYAVLLPNFRGSEGYGNTFATVNRRDLGGCDFRDVMAGVDLLVEQGIADPARLAIMGGSYGGYLTNWAISQTDRFSAAISMFGIFHLVTDYGNSEINRWNRDYLGGYYWEDPEIYRKLSPGSFVQNINTPVLIIHGECDNNTFISNSKEMYQALRARGSVVQFVHYPREGHGLSEPNHKLDEMRRCMEWFGKYLRTSHTAKRVGDRIEHEGYEFAVTRADDADYAGRTEDSERLVEVALVLSSREAVETGWRFMFGDLCLTGDDGLDCPMRGVPMESGGVRMLVEGTNLQIEAMPDADTGRLSLAVAAAFAVPREGGEFAFQLADFPEVVFSLAAQESEQPQVDAEHNRMPVSQSDAPSH